MCDIQEVLEMYMRTPAFSYRRALGVEVWGRGDSNPYALRHLILSFVENYPTRTYGGR